MWKPVSDGDDLLDNDAAAVDDDDDAVAAGADFISLRWGTKEGTKGDKIKGGEVKEAEIEEERGREFQICPRHVRL